MIHGTFSGLTILSCAMYRQRNCFIITRSSVAFFKLTNKQNYHQTQRLITRWCEMVWDSQEAQLDGTEICFTGILASAFISRIWVKPLNFRSPFFFSTVFTDPNPSLLIIHKCLSYSHKSERQFYHHITCSVT